jgi:hypothetical protein
MEIMVGKKFRIVIKAFVEGDHDLGDIEKAVLKGADFIEVLDEKLRKRDIPIYLESVGVYPERSSENE